MTLPSSAVSPTPAAQTPAEAAQELARFLERGRVLVLTGAGVSTDSGIPAYRDERGQWQRPQRPVEFRSFMSSESTRRRYWARSMLGWPRFEHSQPNSAHRALASLEHRGCLSLLLTQNVDGLHQRAGSREVIDLHGRLDGVRCMSCAAVSSRRTLQERLEAQNPKFLSVRGQVAPDGDADLADADYEEFQVVPCENCSGILKPDVVFFGENVPKLRVDLAMQALDQSAGLLVIGSSLMVYSGFRFAKRAMKAGLPVAVLNRGHTRADDFAALRIPCGAGEVLEELLSQLRSSS